VLLAELTFTSNAGDHLVSIEVTAACTAGPGTCLVVHTSSG
jgi:hypothetical protein